MKAFLAILTILSYARSYDMHDLDMSGQRERTHDMRSYDVRAREVIISNFNAIHAQFLITDFWNRPAI